MSAVANPLTSQVIPTAAAQPKPAANDPSALTSKETFLKLLVAQIKNQNPLNPTDSTQFVGQLTQYSELEQLIGINSGVRQLTAAPAPADPAKTPQV